MKTSSLLDFDAVLEKALWEEPLCHEEILCLLSLDNEAELGRLFEVARRLRHRYFGNKVFLYGFVYFSTFCRNHCTFCYYRRSNTLCHRYRKTDEQVLQTAVHLACSGVHLLDLTMGEDPHFFDKGRGFESLLRLVKKVKEETGLPLMISWGVFPDDLLEKLAEAGADWLACYHETHNLELFKRLRIGQDYHRRFEMKEKALRNGMLIEEGILSGVGENSEDVVNSIETMRGMGAHQVRVMNFVPQPGTPMEQLAPPNPERERVLIAVMRLVMPRRLIPASLDVGGIDGLRGKLLVGANVVTSLIPPSSEWMGVAQSTLGIMEGRRTSGAVKPILGSLGLQVASLGDYLLWVNQEKSNLPDLVSTAKEISVEHCHRWRKAARG